MRRYQASIKKQVMQTTLKKGNKVNKGENRDFHWVNKSNLAKQKVLFKNNYLYIWKVWIPQDISLKRNNFLIHAVLSFGVLSFKKCFFSSFFYLLFFFTAMEASTLSNNNSRYYVRGPCSLCNNNSRYYMRGPCSLCNNNSRYYVRGPCSLCKNLAQTFWEEIRQYLRSIKTLKLCPHL